MSPEQGQAKLRKLYGKRAYWRIDERAPKAAERDRCKLALPALRETQQQAEKAMTARRAELLADPLYVRLCDEHRAARKATEDTHYKAYWWRVQIGTRDSIGFHEITAEGDTWAEAIAALEHKQAAA